MALYSSTSDSSMLSLGPLHSTALYLEQASHNDSGYCLEASQQTGRSFQLSGASRCFNGRLSPVMADEDIREASSNEGGSFSRRDQTCFSRKDHTGQKDNITHGCSVADTFGNIGERLPCIGQENSMNDSITIDKYAPVNQINRLLLSELDTDWDNSDLDASCSTCCMTKDCNNTESEEPGLHNTLKNAQEQLRSSVRHLLFMKHMLSCASCSAGESCPVASDMEGELSSFFEVELDTNYYDDTMKKEPSTAAHKHKDSLMKTTDVQSCQYVEMTTTGFYEDLVHHKSKEWKEVSLDDLYSSETSSDADGYQLPHSLTIASDSSAFLETPLSCPPVTLQSKVSKEKKSRFVKKLSQFCKYLHHLGKTHKNNGQKLENKQ